MGQQYISSIGMYSSKKKKKEYSSESSCYDDGTLANECRDMIFNWQYGIFYYEPCSYEEAKIMIKKFRESIDELEKEWI